MNRLVPLIARAPQPAPLRALARPAATSADLAAARLLGFAPAWADDFRLFATAWLGGLIFFGTLIA